jgi:hypothetical protein
MLLLMGYLACTSTAFAQWGGCECKFSNGGYQCLPHLPSFNCETTCKADLSPGVSVRSAKEVGPCALVITRGTYETLVAHIKSSICHQGTTVWTGSEGSTLLRGNALRESLLGGQIDVFKGQAQGRSEIQNAPLSDLYNALGEAVYKCQTEDQGPHFAEHMKWVWDRNRSKTLFDLGDKKDYYSEQGVCHVFSLMQHDHDDYRNICYAFSGPQIQKVLDSFGPPRQ